MKLWKSLLTGGLIVAATGGALALMFKPDVTKEIDVADEPIWDARTTLAVVGEYQPQITLIGRVEPMRELNEIAQLSARVTNLYVKDGMRVEQGELLIQLDDFDAQMQLQQTLADLDDLNSRITLQKSQQQLEIEGLDVERANLAMLEDRLKKQKAITNTQQAIEELEQQIQRQRFAVLQQETAINNHAATNTQLVSQQQKLLLAKRAAERNLANTQIKAPFTGKLAQVLVTEGQHVNPGQALFRLYSEDDMAVLVQLPARLLAEKEQLNGVATEQNRASEVAYDRSEAQIDMGQSGFKAWFKLAQGNQWLPGDIAYLTLNLAAKPQTIKIPAASVFQDRWIYQVDEEQRLKALEVKVLGSLSEGDSSQLVVQATDATDSELRLLLTRLNNPTTGMKIYEAGVDPEPVEATEEPALENDDIETDDEVSDEDA
ncbi:efflux RND transporter periplasmic adaptor subunit [Reinekea sp. G2M2-21]|uniref:efflux RND transporter periplasmic adaptor subunit n=1 Tax=Reinekea sp. G2M2-21 TaxID=2788942 RepID=UPI0018AB629F|nr:biotin/lipoyl-binding protein [Reinekea sp. G2M2-21]